jgi:hypothetical protein
MVTKERIEAATAAKIEPHKHLWGDPRYLSTDVLKLMGVTRNTVNKHMKMTWEEAVRKNRERFQRQERKAAKEKKDE